MNITVDRQELLRSLYITLGVVERKTTMPMLAKVLIEASGSQIRVTATDLEIGVKRTFTGTVEQPGSAVVDARKSYDVARELPADTVKLAGGDGADIEVHAGASEFKLVGADVKEFPSIPVGPPAGRDPKTVVTLAGADMLDVIDKTIFAAAEDDSRVQLSGVYAETPSSGRLRLVATDGHRMAVIERDVEGSGLQPGVILPRKGLAEVKRLLEGEKGAEVSLSVTGGLARLECGAVELSMRLVEGEFPDYQQIVKREGKRSFAVDHDLLLAALRRVAIVSDEVARGVRFQLTEGRLALAAQSSAHGEAHEALEVEYSGDEFSIGFNSRYLLQALSVMGSAGKVQVSMTDEVSACLVRSEEDSGYTYVLMPLRP